MSELLTESRTVEAAAGQEDVLRAVALQRLKKKREFRSHLFVYAVVNLAMWTGWAVDSAINGWEFPWPVFVTFFWGLFVLGHANDVFWKKPISEEEIEREARRLEGTAFGRGEDVR